jgi:hypothetical protein
MEIFTDATDSSTVIEKRKTLERISGLAVGHRLEKNEHLFEFLLQGNTIKSCFTYAKAKLFAEGVEYGRQHPYPSTH